MVLIELLKSQAPSTSLIQLKEIKAERWLKKNYIRFVELDVNCPIVKSIRLECPTEGTIIVDIRKDELIAGIELYNKLGN